MSARPVASLLVHLGAPRAATPQHDTALAQAAVEAAREAGREDARRDYERRLADERALAEAAREAALSDARAQWAAQESRLLSQRLDAALAEIERRLAEGAAQALRPVVEARLAESAARRLAEEARRLLAAQDGPIMRVAGPADLLARLRAEVGADARVAFVETDDADVVATLGPTTVETRLGQWARRLDEAQE